MQTIKIEAKAIFVAEDDFDIQCFAQAKKMYSVIEDIRNRLRTWRKHEDYTNPEKLDDDILNLLAEIKIEE